MRLTERTLPLPDAGALTDTVPPMAAVNSFTIARPSPDPACLAGDLPDWYSRSKT